MDLSKSLSNLELLSPHQHTLHTNRTPLILNNGPQQIHSLDYTRETQHTTALEQSNTYTLHTQRAPRVRRGQRSMTSVCCYTHAQECVLLLFGFSGFGPVVSDVILAISVGIKQFCVCYS